MIGRIIDQAGPSAVRRIARASPSDWGDWRVHPATGTRTFVGHLEGWHYSKDNFLSPCPEEVILTPEEARRVDIWWHRLVHRVGMKRAVGMVRRRAKSRLGNGG